MPHSPPSYAPDDAGITVQSLEFLETPPGKVLREEVDALFAAGKEPTVAQIAALRKRHLADHVHAALTLGRIQGRARAKFSSLPYVWGVPEAVEQASSAVVADWKSRRFAAAGATEIVDLCCGIGGDALALAQVAPTTAVDLSPVRLRALALNSATIKGGLRHPITPVLADVATLLPTLSRDAFFHMDPARRWKSAGKNTRRSPRYEDLLPGPDVLSRVINHFAGGILKLSPAVDFDSLPPGPLELLSESGTVVQALLYCGRVASLFPPGTRTATLLSSESPPFSYTAPPRPPALPTELPPSPSGFLYELDGALTRASLAAPFASEHHLTPLTPDGGYLLSAHLLPHPALTPFELLTLVPFSEKRLMSLLPALPPTALGPVEVKTRGLPDISTDALQKALSKASPNRHTVLLFRHGQGIVAAVAHRLPTPSPRIASVH